jgi:hypothetical protein
MTEDLSRERYVEAWQQRARMDNEARVAQQRVETYVLRFDVCPCGHLAGHDHTCPLD